MSRWVKWLFLTASFGLLTAPLTTWATHIRAGEIRATRISCATLTYKITLIVYTNTNSPTHPGGTFGGGRLSWGSGFVQVPQVTNVTVVNANLHIAVGTYEQTVTFPNEGTFVISFEEAHRNVDILNIPNQSDNIDFYVEDRLVVSRTYCDSSPNFLVPPIDEACKGQVFYHNPGATDADGDSLSYSITTPQGNGGIVISGYVDPNNSKFYTGQNYQTSNSEQNGPPTFSIDSVTGLLTFDAPGAVGSYNIALKVTQWKKNPADSTWMQFGYIVRDMQITVEDCANHPPDVTAENNLCVLAGTLVNLNIKGKDQDLDNVTIEVFSDITSFAESPAVIKYANDLQSTSPDTAHIIISWIPDCIRVRDQPYQVVIKITDSPPNGGVRLTRFQSFTIKVMGPAPTFNDVHVNPAEKTVTLQWDSYTCQNAEAIQIWRRVASRNYNQSHCETGMPKSLQYTLIKELTTSATRYTDHNLAIGAQYCYRVVARFKDTGSKISLETCLIPQPARAPVITNVTVNKTDNTNGQIRISWRPPFDIDQSQYPPPYEYAVQRGKSLDGGDWTTVSSSNISDTVYLDNSIPTYDSAYHYRIFFFVPALTNTVVDTSSTASSVQLKSKSLGSGIKLEWDAIVPWSIFLGDYPYHYIYRSETNADSDFVLIDSVEVNEDGLVYLDKGTYNNEPLNDHKIYYYKVETLGAYGNPKIIEPLINFSPIVFNHIKDTIPPCPPMVSVVKPDCQSLPCSLSYSNTVNVENPTTAGCQNDVVYFEVYVSNEPEATFDTLNSHLENSVFIQNDLNDLSVCYKVIAVDWVGNRSEFSDTVCGENCPAIFMPNVFTPEVVEGKNDVFRPIWTTDNFKDNECSRFIDHMKLLVINRAGKEIFKTESDDFTSVYWDGRDNNGKEMPAGVYYFLADVDLKYASDKKENQQIKGWVHLVR